MPMKYLTLLLLFILALPATVFSQVDYESEIQPIFTEYCVECHGGQNGVTLSSYDAVMNSVGLQYGTEIVVPGDANNSPIVDKISPGTPQYGVRMPQDGNYLSDSQIDLIVQWINEGAHEVPVSNELITELPEGFELKGNYPNPFNPNTTLIFEVPQAVNYTISVYNIAGVLVKEYSGKISAGTESVNLDFASDPSGVYFYNLTAVANQQRYLIGSGKMTLIK